jgi:sugar/nucleoside kinase (ribokinase family)
VSAAPVLCVGILVADVFVPPLERLPDAGELLATDDFLIQPGGCAGNTAISLGRLGVPAAVCACVGDDLLGDFVERDLRSRGIDTSGVRRAPGYPTSKTVIVPVVGEDRRFIHTFGANAALTAGDIEAAALEAAEVVYVGGYLVLPALREEELAARLTEARARGTRVVLDVAVPAGSSLSLEAASALLPLADYVVPNADEARALTGESEPSRQAERLLERGAHTVVVKLGERGAYVRSAGEAFEVPAPPVEVVEPSGAGDAFAAGLVLGILEGWDLERSVRFASVLGASACTALGCWGGVFTRSEAEAFLEANPLPARAAGAA